MRILVITPIFPPDIGGPAGYVSSLVSILKSLGHTVSVVTFSKSKTKQYDYPVQRISTVGNALLRQLRLARAIFNQSSRADYFYAQGTLTVGLVSVLLSKILRKKSIVKFVGDEVWETHRNSGKTTKMLEDFYTQKTFGFKEIATIFLHRLVLRLSTQIVVPSNYLKQFLLQSHGIDPEKIVVIANPVDTYAVLEDTKKNHLVFVGRLVAWKHVDLLIRLFCRLDSDYSLTIVGDGPERAALESLVQKNKLGKRVVFTGSLSKKETHKYIARAEFVCLFSDYEGQSHTLIEALCYGTKVVVSDIAPNRDLVGKNGAYLSLKARESLSKLLKEAPEISSEIISQYQKNHSWDTHVRKFEECL